MHDDVVSLHGVVQLLDVTNVRPVHGQPLVAAVMCEMPVSARREVVVHRDARGALVAEQAVDEMATEKARAANDEPALARAHPRDSHTGALCCSAGWETRR